MNRLLQNTKVSTLLSAMLILLSFHANALSPNGTYSSDNDGFRYTGRISFNEESAYLTWPGTSVSFSFSGRKLVLDLEDDKGNNYFNVIINDNQDFPLVLNTKKGRHQYDISYAINTDVSSVTLFKRTEGAEGGTFFHGVSLDSEEVLLDSALVSKRRILFYGDSITVGMGNEAADNNRDNLASEKNHYLSYAAITARNLDAEFHSIAKSGIGFMVSWFDFIMPEYYDQLTGESNNDSTWDFEQWQPHVVVVNLGQNDKWLIENERKLVATPQEIQNAYEAFIRKLMRLHPDATFVCAIGSMDASRDERWPGYIDNAVNKIKVSPDNEGDSTRIYTTVFEFNGYGAHPRVAQHHQNAEKLTSILKTVMGW